jgi:drug/metabolite transporter (DMT)-like permease
MKIGNIVRWSYIVGLITTLAGAYLNILHAQGADVLLALGLGASLVFILTAIYEVQTSKRIGSQDKIMWTIALIFMSGIAGLMYFFWVRKRVVDPGKA